MQLDFLAHRLPSELSGGQRQRVALARALAVQPAVLLLDEPFGALDAKVRQELRSWLRRLHDEIGLTSVFVTHDQEEALELADRVVIFNHGVIEQDGTPEEVVEHPATPFVANFVGRVNVFHGRLESGKAWFGPVVVDHPTPLDGATHAEGYARPHELDVTREDVGGGLWATLRHASPAGALVKIDLTDPGGRAAARGDRPGAVRRSGRHAGRAGLRPSATPARLSARAQLTGSDGSRLEGSGQLVARPSGRLALRLTLSPGLTLDPVTLSSDPCPRSDPGGLTGRGQACYGALDGMMFSSACCCRRCLPTTCRCTCTVPATCR